VGEELYEPALTVIAQHVRDAVDDGDLRGDTGDLEPAAGRDLAG
jgi:hypothetical protein